MRCILLIALMGCSSGEVEDNRGKRTLGPVGGLDLGGSDGGEGEGEGEGDSADGTDGSGGSDDTALPTDDTGSGSGDGTGDEGSGGDTGAPTDTGEEEPTCGGITAISPTDAYVVSTDTYEEVTVTLTGCATGLWVEDGGIYSGAAGYLGTWASVPTSFDGTADLLVIYTGPAAYPAEGGMYFTFHSDQGDFGEFRLWFTPS